MLFFKQWWHNRIRFEVPVGHTCCSNSSYPIFMTFIDDANMSKCSVEFKKQNHPSFTQINSNILADKGGTAVDKMEHTCSKVKKKKRKGKSVCLSQIYRSPIQVRSISC